MTLDFFAALRDILAAIGLYACILIGSYFVSDKSCETTDTPATKADIAGLTQRLNAWKTVHSSIEQRLGNVEQRVAVIEPERITGKGNIK